MADTAELRMRLTRGDDAPASNPAGDSCVFGLQDAKGGIVPGLRRADGSLVFDFTLLVRLAPDGRLRFTGPVVSGPAEDRFVYLAWRSTTRGEYINRVKARLSGIDWALVREVQASGGRLVADMTGWRPGDPRKQVTWCLERTPRVLRLDHVQIAMPAGREDDARAFYGGALGLPEATKPTHLAARGGCWFESGALKVHLGVEDGFVPARKAHPAFVVEDLTSLVSALAAAGYRVVEDQPLEGYERRYVDDPFGNRIELMQPKG